MNFHTLSTFSGDIPLRMQFRDVVTTPTEKMEISFAYGDIIKSAGKLSTAALRGQGKDREEALAELWEIFFPLYPLPDAEPDRSQSLEGFAQYYSKKLYPFLFLCSHAIMETYLIRANRTNWERFVHKLKYAWYCIFAEKKGRGAKV